MITIFIENKRTLFCRVGDNFQRVSTKKDGPIDRGYDRWKNSRQRPRQRAQTQLLVTLGKKGPFREACPLYEHCFLKQISKGGGGQTNVQKFCIIL